MSSRLTIWGDAKLRTLLGPRREHLPFPLESPTCSWYARGRHALWSGVRQLGLEPPDEVLVPAYHHGSEVEALRSAGIRCCFYDVEPNLAPNPAELESLVSSRTRALLLIHHLGRPQAASQWREWCDERGLLLIEDAAQAWLSMLDDRAVGSFGDASIFCLYKMISAPDGAALVTASVPEPALRRAPIGMGLLLAERVRPRALANVARAVERRAFRRRREPSMVDFELGDPGVPISRVSRALIVRSAGSDVAEQRRANYRSLLHELADWVRAPFDHLPEGASPMVFPLTVEPAQKREVLDRLRRADIEAVEAWAVPHPSLPVEQFPRSAELRASLVAVPVHQGLSPRDLDRIVDVVR